MKQASNTIDLQKYQGKDKIVSSFELYETLKGKAVDVGIKSGIPGLDYFTKGFRLGELVIISGPTGNGKTLLAQSLTDAFCKKGEEPLWFSFELPAWQFLNTFPDLAYFYMPSQLKHGDMNWFEERCLEAWEKQRSRIVFIDHLHFLIDMFRIKQPSLEIGACVRRLKRFAVERNFLIFLLCHITKIEEGTKARLRHIRDSQMIPAEADTVLLIQRGIGKNGDKNHALITIDKCRETGFFDESTMVQKLNGYLVELSKEEIPF